MKNRKFKSAEYYLKSPTKQKSAQAKQEAIPGDRRSLDGEKRSLLDEGAISDNAPICDYYST